MNEKDYSMIVCIIMNDTLIDSIVWDYDEARDYIGNYNTLKAPRPADDTYGGYHLLYEGERAIDSFLEDFHENRANDCGCFTYRVTYEWADLT